MRWKIWLALAVTVGFVLGLWYSIKMRLYPDNPDSGVVATAPAFQVSGVSARLTDTHQETRVIQAYQSFLNTLSDTRQPVAEYELRYTIERSGKPSITGSAQVFIPTISGGQTLPVLVYGAGTTGLANRCAPSEENPLHPTLGNYENQMITHAAQGMVMIMPDYLGFDTKQQLQYYFIAEEEAYSMLSAAQAFFTSMEQGQITTNIAEKEIFVGGYSQGGHSAFAAADYGKQIAPQLNIRGIIGHGPTTDVIKLLKENPNLAPYVTSAYQSYYDTFDPSKIINAAYLETLDEAERICADEGFGYNTVSVDQIFTEPFARALETNSIVETVPTEGQLLLQNAAGTRFTDIPVFMAQGTTDDIVTKADQDAVVAELCTRGVPVTYTIYEGKHHFFIRQSSFNDVHSWMKQVLEEQAAKECMTKVGQ